jgi:hypothetical protein
MGGLDVGGEPNGENRNGEPLACPRLPGERNLRFGFELFQKTTSPSDVSDFILP